MGRRRHHYPTSFPTFAAPLVETVCICPQPDPIKTGDKKRRCRGCAGIVEAQLSLTDQPKKGNR